LISKCGFEAIKDRLIIIVDSSELKSEAHAEVWQSNREDISQTDEGQQYQQAVEKSISDSTKLKELNRLVKEKRLQQLKTTGQSDVFKSLLSNNRQMLFLMSDFNPDANVNLPVPGSDIPPSNYEGLDSPTYIKRKASSTMVNVRINNSGPIIFETDACNNYFDKPHNPGTLIHAGIENNFGINSSMNDGQLRVFVKCLASVKIGDVFKVKFGLADDTMSNPAELWAEELTISVIGAKTTPSNPREKNDDKDIPPQTKSPPTMVLEILKEDDEKKKRIEEEFGVTVEVNNTLTSADGGYIEALGDGQDVYHINYDNLYHHDFISKISDDVEKRVLSRRYVYGMLLLMMGLEGALLKEGENAENLDKNAIRRMASKAAASVIFVISESLTKSITVEKNEKPKSHSSQPKST